MYCKFCGDNVSTNKKHICRIRGYQTLDSSSNDDFIVATLAMTMLYDNTPSHNSDADSSYFSGGGGSFDGGGSCGGWNPSSDSSSSDSGSSFGD